MRTRDYIHPIVGRKFYAIALVTDKGVEWLREQAQQQNAA